MSQCLRCSKSCSASAVFCDECRSLLRNQLQQTPAAHLSSETAPQSILPSERREVRGDPLQRITSPLPLVNKISHTRPPLLAAYTNMVDHALSRLSEAAQRIAEVEREADGTVNRRVPHPSRLAPMRDISADIRRESTPLQQVHMQGEDLAQRLPDLWPWLPETDPEENETWTNHTDPLQSRHFPSSAEAAQIEAEDIRRALAEGISTSPFLSVAMQQRKRPSRIRLIFSVLALMAVLALAVDGVLLSVAFNHAHRTVHQNNGSGPASLTITPNVAFIGLPVSLRVNHFTPFSSVLLTHDIYEEVKTDTNSSILSVGASGSAAVNVIIDNSWGPGFHQIYAEDVKTRYTATAQLQIINQGPTRPSHFVVGVSPINMGADLQGKNTTQTLTLSNSGGGSISWAASSNVAWLLLSPTQGVFSESQTITVAVERSNLKPSDYKGMITISSNVSSPQSIPVEMTVKPLPANVGPVLAVNPAVLSFVATDGGANPYTQVLTISNPGSKPLSWSLVSNTPATAGSQFSLFHALGSQANWLFTSRTAGIVAPGSTGLVYVSISSQNLLPGTYTGSILFSASGEALDSSQTVSVSLTIQPQCGLATSTGNMSFTAVVGSSNPSNQILSLGATASCVTAVNWHANVSANWLVVTPTSAALKGVTPTAISIGVNTSGLTPASYSGVVAFITFWSTQTVTVNLTVQPPPAPTVPILSASPLTINFSNIQGRPNPSNQIVTITNSGGGTLYWNTNVTPLASSWLNAYASGGSVLAGQSGQFMINVNTANLTPGNYVGQITLYGHSANGINAGGSPEILMVNLVVQPPCSLAQPSSIALAFSATVGGSNPSSETFTVTGSGSCGWPLLVSSSVLPSPQPWLQISPTTVSSIKGTGQSVSINVAPLIAGLAPGTYTAQISVAATDSSGTQAQGSPQLVSVTLSVLQPCLLHVNPASLNFSVPQGQASSARTFSFNETGSCARPVSWTAAGDAGSVAWLNLSSTSGIDAGRGSTIGVTVNPPSTLPPGTYTGQITITASGNGGAVVQRSPQMMTVNLTVTGYVASGTVMACLVTDPTCATPVPLPNATVALMNGTNTITTVTADALGNFTIPSIPLGNYTLSASGIDSSGIHYIGTLPLNVTGNQTHIIVKVNQSS